MDGKTGIMTSGTVRLRSSKENTNSHMIIIKKFAKFHIHSFKLIMRYCLKSAYIVHKYKTFFTFIYPSSCHYDRKMQLTADLNRNTFYWTTDYDH
jgi:hypothetical protein